ncbi:hypothetical protein VTN02DRAFT_4278 [Thermoascus thermophilus]
MSTQTARSIRFTHASPQQGFRLLELPAELLELLSSENAPTLQLKSPSPELAQVTVEPGSREYVNLCTPTKTFRLRQVQSSNSIHIIRPSQAGSLGDDNGADGGVQGGLDLAETVTTIAKCGSTLELHTPQEGFSALPFLEKSLRLYDRLSTDGDVEMKDLSADVTPSEAKRLKELVFADVPVSTGQCESDWREMCAFVHGDINLDQAVCWRPSARVKLEVWKRMLEGSVLQGIDLEKQFLVRDLWKAVLDDDGEEPFPRVLFEAVVRRLLEPSDHSQLQSPDSEMKWVNIDRTICTRWVGETYLEATAPTTDSAVARATFINTWKDYLPEPWRNEASVSQLTDGSYKHPDPTTICFVSGVERQKIKSNSLNKTGATAVKNPRNWHERFRNQKRS